MGFVILFIGSAMFSVPVVCETSVLYSNVSEYGFESLYKLEVWANAVRLLLIHTQNV